MDTNFGGWLEYQVPRDVAENMVSEEIEQTIFGINDNKALGPDGFSVKFFKKTWKIRGKDVVVAF